MVGFELGHVSKNGPWYEQRDSQQQIYWNNTNNYSNSQTIVLYINMIYMIARLHATWHFFVLAKKFA